MRDDGPLGMLFVIGTVVLVALALGIARKTGADWDVVLTALVKSALFVVLILASTYVFATPLAVRLAACIAVLYPTWWPVLDSIALQHDRGLHSAFGHPDLPWWRAGWFNWLTELALIVAMYFAVRGRNHLVRGRWI